MSGAAIAPAPDFLFLVPRQEFSDFVAPVLPLLQNAGFNCEVLAADDASTIAAQWRNQGASPPPVVVCGNETPAIAEFPEARKVLLAHSLFMRDDIPSPLEQGAAYYMDFDYFFCPSAFYLEWTVRSLFDAHYFAPERIAPGTAKTVIPGGYAKRLPQPASPEPGERTGPPVILYAPSIFSPEHPGHLFHKHGKTVLSALLGVDAQAQIICRPHPTDRHRDYVREARDFFSDIPNVLFDLEDTPSPLLYSRPDVLITDMSGFAFVHAGITQRRPVFLIGADEAQRHPRFAALARQYGRIAGDTVALIEIVQAQLQAPDVFDAATAARFRGAFSTPHNSAEHLAEDLVHILRGECRAHWLRLPLSWSH